jgi:nucleotide-binding universal stress UspA family protein
MQHIIVPVDLSPNSKVALRYAAHMASAFNVGITVVFAFSLLEKAVRYTTRKGQVDKDPDKWIQKRIDKIHAQRPEVDVQYNIIKGDILDNIKRQISITDADLIIMGCQGKDENAETWLGSTAVAVIKTSNVPVMLIPPKFKFRGLQNLVFASNKTSANAFGPIKLLNQLQQVFQPNIQIVHLDSEKATDTLQETLIQQNADLLIVYRHEKGIFETNMESSRIRAEKFKINIPLLALVGEES